MQNLRIITIYSCLLSNNICPLIEAVEMNQSMKISDAINAIDAIHQSLHEIIDVCPDNNLRAQSWQQLADKYKMLANNTSEASLFHDRQMPIRLHCLKKSSYCTNQVNRERSLSLDYSPTPFYSM